MATTSMNKFRESLGKRYGQRLTRADVPVKYEIISTGSMTLDIAMRTGGWVRGRTHEIVGPPGAAKTTLSILTAIEHQKADKKKAVGWVDMEHSFDWDWAEALGLDTSERRFTHINPDDSEDVADMIKLMAQSDLYSNITVDSIGGMESKKAFEKEAGEVTMGRNAQVITRMVKQVATLAWNNKITILFVNQHRANLAYAGADIPAGPKALQYNTTMSVKMGRKSGPASDTTLTSKIDGEDEIVAERFVAKVTRSRVAPKGRQAEYWLINQPTEEHGPIGLDRVDEAVNIGLRAGVIGQSGAFYTVPNWEKAIQGRTKLVAALKKDAAAVEFIRDQALKGVKHEVTEETETTFTEATDE